MTKSFQKIKSFSIGLCIAGIGAVTATALPISQGSCVGSCAQCGTCGLTALPLVLWLATKRWKPIARIRILFARRILRVKRSCAFTYCSKEKFT